MPSLSFAAAVATAPLVAAYRTLQYFTVGTPFDNELTKKSWARTLTVALGHHVFPLLSIEDILGLNKSVSRVLESFRSSAGKNIQGFGDQYTTIDPNTQYSTESVWLSYYPGAPVLLYFHGGCFALNVRASQIKALINVHDYYKQNHKKVSILVLDYSLTSQGKLYPRQNNECAFIYDKLVADGNKDIVLIGESVGAYLEINLLRHIAQSSHKVWPKGVAAISPWLNITIRENVGSFADNHYKDFLNHSILNYHGQVYIDHDNFGLDKSPEINIEANQAAVNWEEIPNIKNGNILLLIGENEVLKDEIVSWADYTGLSSKFAKNVAIEPRGTHASFFLLEPLTYLSLDDWSNFFSTRKVLAYLNDIL